MVGCGQRFKIGDLCWWLVGDTNKFESSNPNWGKMQGYVCGATWPEGRGKQRLLDEGQTELLICKNCLKKLGFLW